MTKTNEELIVDYQNALSFLESKGETWRMKYTIEEYLLEVEKIREVEANHGWFNDYHKQTSISSMLSLLLQPKLTFEEAKAQVQRMTNAANEQFMKEAPAMQDRMRKLTAPLNLSNLRIIYSALFRNQITLDDLPIDVLEAFKESRIGQNWMRRKAD